MFKANGDIYWRAFVLVSLSYTVFLALFLLGFNNDQQHDSNENDHTNEFEKEREKFE